MRMEEVHRFRTPLLEDEGHLYWDIDVLWTEIQRGLALALRAAPTLRSVSVDSWAVDYVPLNAEGCALRRPYGYRDTRTRGRLATAIRLAGGADALYGRTGIQFLELNTLPQVIADLEDEPEMAARTAIRLLIADYFLFRLSGKQVAERTMASTTQLMDVRTGAWSLPLLHAIGDESSRWPRIVPPGTILGPLARAALPGQPALSHAPLVLATCSHDTAAAVAAVPATETGAWAYLSSGTWSLIGAELRTPILTSAAREAGFSNEAGLDGTIRFLKNRAGMWVLEECCREWAADGVRPSYDALIASAAAAPPSEHTIDLNAPEFATRGGMQGKIEALCRTRMAVPQTRGALVRLILESLAESSARALAELESLTGTQVSDLHVVGGGALNELLNQLTADACDRRVIAGPDEATVLGNLLVQARTLGDLPTGVSVRAAARRSTRLTEYTPPSAARRATASSAH
jgi:rhamnulokinase